MRVVLTIAGLSSQSGGPSRSVPSLALALADAGVSVEIVSLDFGPKESPPLLPSPSRVRTHLVRCRFSRFMPTLWAYRFDQALRQSCQGTSPVILHDNGAWLPTNHLAARMSRSMRIPLVVSPRGMLTAWSLGFKRHQKKWAWWLYQRRNFDCARMFHLTSIEEAEDIRKLGFRQPLAVIPNGVDLIAFVDKQRPAARIRTALFLSRIHPKKGLLQLADAWAELRPRGWRVIIAGPNEGGHKEELLARLHTNGITHDFAFSGPVDGPEKENLYQSADLFVLPSFSENFGLAIAEALAAGVPVITTRGTPWAELVSRRCGWWIEQGSGPLASTLRDAMSRSDEERMEMGRRGRRWIEECFTWSSVARQMKIAYQGLLDQKQGLRLS